MSNLLRITNKIEALGIWDSVPSDSINSVDIEFEFAEDWKNLLCVAQFTQGEKTYNVVIENNRCVLPTELKIGNVMLSVFGTKTDGTPFRETSIPFCFEIYDAGFSSTSETPIPPTPDLYEQLIDKFSKDVVNSLNGKTGKVDIVADEGISVDDTETGKIKIKSTATITVDPEMSDTSENPVQNKVVKGYVDNAAAEVKTDFTNVLNENILPVIEQKLDTIDGGTVSGNVEFTGDVIIQNAPTVPKSAVNKEYADSLKTVIDSAMSDTSENPVQNKVVKKYADDKIKYRIINDITITEDISAFSTSQDDNGNAFDLQKFFFLFIGKFDAALSKKPLSLSVKKGAQFLMYKEFTVAADTECALWLEADSFLRTSSAVGIKSTYSSAFLRNFKNGISQGLSANNQAVNSDISLVPVTLPYPAGIYELRFSVHDQTIKMKKGSRFLLLGIDYNA